MGFMEPGDPPPHLITWEKGGASVMSATLLGWMGWSRQQPNERQRDFRSMSSTGTKRLKHGLCSSGGNRQKRVISLSVGCELEVSTEEGPISPTLR